MKDFKKFTTILQTKDGTQCMKTVYDIVDMAYVKETKNEHLLEFITVLLSKTKEKDFFNNKRVILLDNRITTYTKDLKDESPSTKASIEVVVIDENKKGISTQYLIGEGIRSAHGAPIIVQRHEDNIFMTDGGYKKTGIENRDWLDRNITQIENLYKSMK